MARRGRTRSVGFGLLRVGDFLVSGLLFIGAWQLLHMAFDNPVLFPGPAAVATEAVGMAGGRLGADIAASLARIAVGYLLGVTIGILLGALIGQVHLADRFISPVIGFVRMVPPVALIPLAIIWFGIGESSKYFIVMWGTLIAVLFSTADGVMNTPRPRLLAARCMGASRLRILWDVTLPSAVPMIWTGMKISVGLAFSSVVAAELIAAREGIGALIMNSRVMVQVDQMFVGLLLLALIGGTVDRLVAAIGGRALRRYLVYVRA